MKFEIVKGINEIQLYTGRINATFVCPRKNETVVVNGKRHFVREVVHQYDRIEDVLKIFVEEE